MGGGAYLVYLHHCTVVDLMRYAPGRCFLLGGEPATCRELGKTCRVGSHVQMLRMSRSRPASLLGAGSMLGGWIELVVDPNHGLRIMAQVIDAQSSHSFSSVM